MEDSEDEGSDKDSEKEEEEEEEDEDSGDTKFPGSKLIKGSFQSKLHKWTNQKKGWKLIYRASKDGYSASTFHSKCDNQGPTIVIIKSNLGNIFGGYNKNSWTNNNQYSISMENFLFSYKNKDKKQKKPVLIKSANQNQSYSAYGGSSYHVTFGGGHDLYLCDNCNSTNSSYSNLGYTYSTDGLGGGYTYNQQNTKDFLAGSYNFTCAEIEIYKNLGKK